MNLTAQELTIAKLVANGATNRHCAVEMRLSRHRIEQVKIDLYRKLGVSGIADLTHAAIALGIVPVKPLPRPFLGSAALRPGLTPDGRGIIRNAQATPPNRLTALAAPPRIATVQG